MKILVTGANGLLGANVVRELLRRGADVRILVRKSSNLSPLAGLDIEEQYGDITNPKDVDKAVAGSDIIIHIAALTSQHHISLKSYLPVNVRATEILLACADKYNIKRIIYVSSAATFGYGSKEYPGSELQPISFPFNKLPYVRSKHYAQQIMLKAASKIKTDIVVVNPSFMIGPYDSKPSSGQIILMAFDKRFVMVPPGGKSFIHVNDAAIAVCNAITLGKNGECYILSNQNLSYNDFFNLVDEVSATKSIHIPIPRPVLLIIGAVGSLIAKTGVKISLNYNNARTLCESNFYSNSKSVKELQMPLSSIKKAISESVLWFRENGYLSMPN
jgi:nucleoside-diphosphate-sugar epimerase